MLAQLLSALVGSKDQYALMPEVYLLRRSCTLLLKPTPDMPEVSSERCRSGSYISPH